MKTIVASFAALMLSSVAMAGQPEDLGEMAGGKSLSGNEDVGLDNVDNQADVNHPDIHDKVGDGSNANPENNSPAGGNEIHGIADTSGQDGDHPNDDGRRGFANEIESVHGGIGDVNPQAD